MKKWALLEENLLELIRRTSTDLPADVESALRRACVRGKTGSRARGILETILTNVAAARENDLPICQDTGALLFYFTTPPGVDPLVLMAATRKAVAQATSEGFLRENTLDALNNAPYPNNVGNGAPVFHFVPGARDTISVQLIMKGGGSENM
ncbi:MAG: fumarate hydratase, partial [bacterium]